MYYTDKPINTEKDDELGRNGFAKLLAKALISFERTELLQSGFMGNGGVEKLHSTSEITEMYYVKRDNTRLVGITDGFAL